jgi:hypothetical protein
MMYTAASLDHTRPPITGEQDVSSTEGPLALPVHKVTSGPELRPFGHATVMITSMSRCALYRPQNVDQGPRLYIVMES